MKALLSWLREFAPGIEGDPFALGDVLSDIGLCCEEVQLLDRGLDGIVVARVLDLRRHPDADKIQLVDVDAGDGEALQICCGAFNMQVGDLVPLATVGTTMPDGMEITRRKLRGEWSNGMLCSPRELGLGDDHGGILVLRTEARPGAPLSEALGVVGDALFDIDLTPNRPDALSMAGIARDLAAKLAVPFELPDIGVAASGEPAGQLAAVELLDPDLCGRFTARVLSGVRVGESPGRIARRLTLLGMRPINSIVDVSNYVMLEYGQPNHTFDLAKLPGGRLRVRRAGMGESLLTLDGVTRPLQEGDGVIADAGDEPVGIAGIMGGASTEISPSTTDVLLELAWWDPRSIARTSARLGLRSEASARFEKGVDPEIAHRAADRFCELAAGLGAKVHPGEIVVEGRLPERGPILVRTDRVHLVLGRRVEPAEVTRLLHPLGFEPAHRGDDVVAEPPSWRPDVTGEIDVIEEVARHRGYDTFGTTVPVSAHVGGLTREQRARRRLRELLVDHGALEAAPMPFLAPGDLERCGVRADAVVVTNPLAAEESVLRTALLPGLLRALATNAAHRQHSLTLFELGRCYAEALEGDELPQEWTELGVAIGGADAVRATELLRLAVGVLGLPEPELVPAAVGGLHPTRAAHVRVAGLEVGEVGELDPLVTTAAGVEERVGWIRLDLDALLAVEVPPPQFRPVSRYPSADIDLAFAAGDEVPVHELRRTLASAHELAVEVALFDVYRGDQVPEGTRSLAFSVRLQAPDRTLTDDEVAAARVALVEAAATRHGAVLRG